MSLSKSENVNVFDWGTNTEDLIADALRVREQFDALRSGRDSTNEQCCNRVERCERLLSEGYELAAEGEGLLREREARLRELQEVESALKWY